MSALRGILLALLLAAGSAAAQEAIDAPITATALPQLGLPGATIALSGTTPRLAEGTEVTVSLSLDTSPGQPGGEADAPAARKAAVDAKGRWRLVLKDSDTTTLGRYTVRATAPDGKGEATSQFDIVDDDALDELVERYTEEMNRSLDLTEGALITQLTDLALGLPDGPEKDGIVVRVNKVVQRLREAKQHRPPPLPPIAPPPPPATGEAAWPKLDYTPVLETFRDITAESERIRQELPRSNEKTDNCLRMDSLIESINLASSLSNFIGSGLEKALNHLGDKVLPAMIERKMAPATQFDKNVTFAMVESTKVAIAKIGGWKGVVAGVPGLGLDAINHGAKYFYEQFCTRYEGAFTATLQVDHYTDDGALYWTYTTRLGGLASLTEPKPGEGQVDGSESLLRGRFDGAAIGYDARQDALKINPKLRQMLVYEQLIVPPKTITLPPVEMGAMFNALVSPVGFQVPITAERRGDKVTVNLGDAMRDMDPKINRGLLVQVFQAGPIPAPNYQVFPMQDAHFILSRGMRKDAVLTRESNAQGAKLSGTFHREETPPGVKVVWDVQVEMCSPACASTSIDRLKAWYDAAMAKRKAAKR